MGFDILELSSADRLPDLKVSAGVAPLSAVERDLHSPDRHLLVLNDGTLIARCPTLPSSSPALNDALPREDRRPAAALPRLREGGIVIRAFAPNRAAAAPRRLYTLSLGGFSRNFLYTPIAEAEFLAQNRALL